MCFRDRGIDRLCMKHVSLIGVMMQRVIFCFPPSSLSDPSSESFLLISSGDCGSFPYPQPLVLLLIYPLLTMSSPSSSYVQIGLDNLEHPLNCSPSPRAQVRGFDWSLVCR